MIILLGCLPWYMVAVSLPAQGVDPDTLFQQLGIGAERFVVAGWWTLASGLLFLIASVGLARFREWARLLFLLLVGATIALHLFGLLALGLVDSMAQDFAAELGDPGFAQAASAIVISGYLLTGTTVVLFGWVMWRLTRSDVAALFAGEGVA